LESAGIELLFLGGFGAAASGFGLPDLGFLSMVEMADAVRRMTDQVRVPLIADADTGFGDLRNVAETVRQYERAGAAGLLLEDQVSPKRCGHFSGKAVIPADEMQQKLKTALDARQDENFVIIARTDAIAVEGFDAAIERAQLYVETGADICFVEAPESREQLEQIPKDVDAPLLANMLVGGKTPILSTDELEQLGYKIAVCPVESLMAAGFAIRKLAETFLKSGRVDQLQDELLSFDELKRLLGADDQSE